MSKNPLSLSLVLVQSLSIIFIFLTGPVLMENIFLFLIEVFALLLGLWAILVVSHKSKIQISPEVAPGSKLVTEGPYKKIRHPMYSALLLLTLVLVLNSFTWQRMIFWIILFIDLLVKIHYEENILERYFNGYKDYQKNTFKIIPFIY